MSESESLEYQVHLAEDLVDLEALLQLVMQGNKLRFQLGGFLRVLFPD